MNAYEQIQQGKVATAYGGPGSLIESYKYGCLKIKLFDEWRVCDQPIENQQRGVAEAHRVTDDAKALSIAKGHYTNVEYLFVPPTNEYDVPRWANRLRNRGDILNAEQFPKWYFCRQCQRLGHVDWWKEQWDLNYRTLGLKSWDELYVPHCVFCAEQANQRGGRRRYFQLEQMRYVAASNESGDIVDIPWDKLATTAVSLVEEIEFDEGRMTDNTGQYINLTDLKYTTSSVSDNLQNMYISHSGSKRSLGDLTKIKFKRTDGKEFKMVVRSASNVYNPVVYNSLFVPYGLSDKVKQAIDTSLEMKSIMGEEWFNGQIEVLCKGYPNETIFIKAYANGTDWDLSDNLEFDYIVNNDKISTDNLIYERAEGINNLGIKNLYNIRKLRETSILMGYTRLDGRTMHHIAQNPDNVRFIPCIKRFGEGVLVEFDKDKINLFVEDLDDSRKSDAILTVIHTFAHAIIKEMEFECGYDSTSFKEKIYIDETNGRYGFIVYCVAGAEGSMGGVTSLFDGGNINKLIKNAVDRLQMCPHDPICSQEKGHCYACLDLSEVSCYKNNEYLHRQKLTDFISKINL